MKKLFEEIKKFKGNVVTVGITDDKIKRMIEKQNGIGLYELELNIRRKVFSKQKKVKTKNGKTVKIKKFRSIFKKKSIEYVVIDLNSVYEFYKYMASNSIYICKKNIYIYGTSEYTNAKSIAKKFKRYNTKIETVQEKDNYLVIIDCSKAKFSIVKEKFYLVVDTFINLGDMISYFLTS